MDSKSSSSITPRLIIHGGAGNILPSNLPREKYQAYHKSLLTILSDTHHYQLSGDHTALDTVSFAVSHLENNPLFNSGHGAVFTREGVNELEASIMVSSGHSKRGVGVMGLRHVKNPIKLAREMLLRGDRDLEGGNGEHRGPMMMSSSSSSSSFNDDAEMDGVVKSSAGAQGHCQLHGEGAEELARAWGLDLVDPSYFFVQARWDEHIAGLEREKSSIGLASWDAEAFVPQGTCGAVAMDSKGVVACATSTGGMTNKLSGRIGDTPTLGAGFWAEKWEDVSDNVVRGGSGPILELSGALRGLVADCLPSLNMYVPVLRDESKKRVWRGTGMSGTGNGDSFLRMNAVRTASAIARYRPGTSLKEGMRQVTGPGGELEKSAGKRWKKTGEGEGGIIGIEARIEEDADGEVVGVKSAVLEEYNCGGMFRAAINDEGKAICRVWRPGQYDGLEDYVEEGVEYDVTYWRSEKPKVVS